MKKLIAAASAVTLLATQLLTGALPTASAVANIGQCLPASEAPVISSITSLSNGNLQVDMTYSSSMMGNPAWQNSKVRFYARETRTVETSGYYWGGTVDNMFANQTPSSFSGNTATFILANPPVTFDYWDSGHNNVHEIATNLVALPEMAMYPYGSYSSTYGFCDGFIVARKIPASGNYSLLGNSGTYYTVSVVDSNDNEGNVTVQLTSPASGSALVNGQTVTSTPITLSGLSGDSILSFSADGVNSSFYRPRRSDFSGGIYPSVRNSQWSGNTLMVEVDSNNQWVNRCNNYCLQGRMPETVRYISAEGGVSNWIPLGTPGGQRSLSFPPYSQINTYYLTPPPNTSSMMFGYNSSFRVNNPIQEHTDTYNQVSSYFYGSVPTPPDNEAPIFSTTEPFVINNNAATVSNADGRVTLSPIVATDNSGSFTCSVSNSPSSGWQTKPCNTQITNWNLATNDESGSKFVYAQVCDAANNCSVTSDSIVWFDNDYESQFCLAPTNGFTLDTITPLGDNQYELKLTMSAAMASKSVWKNAKYRITLSDDNSYGYPDDDQDDKSLGDLTPTSIVGNTVTLRVTLDDNDKILSYWQNGDRHNDFIARYLTVTNVKAIYNDNGGHVCSGMTYAKKIPTTRDFSFQDIAGNNYSFTIQDVVGTDNTVTATMTTPAPAAGAVSIQGQNIVQNQAVTLNNLAIDHVLRIDVPNETFEYNFLRPSWGDRDGTTLLSFQSVTRATPDTAVFKFRRSYGFDGSYQSNDYTFYRYVAGTNNAQGQFQQTSASQWIAIPDADRDYNGTDNRYLDITLHNLPADAVNVYFTVDPSRVYSRNANHSSDNDRYYSQYVLNQVSTGMVSSSSNPSLTLPDITAPAINSLTVSGSANNFVNTTTIRITPTISENQGLQACYAGRTATDVNTVVDCAGFDWNLFTGAPVDGPVTVYFRAVDTSNNPSNVTSITVTYDHTPPTVNQTGSFQNFPWTAAPYSLNLTPNDGTGASGGTIRYTLSDSNPGTCGSPTTLFGGSVTVDHPQYLCYEAQDILGNTSQVFGPFQLRVDGAQPAISNMHVEVGGQAVTPQNQVTYLTASAGTVRFDAADTDSGIDPATCSSLIDDNQPQPADTCTITDGAASITLPPTLTDGMHVFQATVADLVGNQSAATINIFVDSHNPVFTVGTPDGNIGTQLVEPGRRMTVTLPTSFEDNSISDPLNNSGIASAHINLSLENGVGTLTLTDQNIEGWDAAHMSRNGNTLVITPAATGPTFPSTITFVNLPDRTAQDTQLSYQVTFNAFDHAGNGLVETANELHRGNLRFDTQAPNINVFTRLGVSPRLGDGTEANPYRVGAIGTLNGRLFVTELSNNTAGSPTTPLTLDSINTFDANQTPNAFSANPIPSCVDGSLDGTNSCNLSTTYTVANNFNGRVEISVRDNAQNISTPAQFWVRQDSNRPQLLENFDLTANVLPGEHFKGSLYQFRATGVDKQGDDKVLTAFITYTNAGGQRDTAVASMTESAANQFDFSAALNGISEGGQILDIYFEDNYGNRHQEGNNPAEHLIHYDVFHDSVRPVVTNFTYTWSDNAVNVSFDSITDASFPINIVVESSANGTTDWAPFGSTITRADGSAHNFTISDVPVGHQLSVRFGDTVKDYLNNGQNGQLGTIGDATNPNTFFIVRDMVLSVEEGPAQLNIGYVPETTLPVSNIAAYEVSYTGPHGREGIFDSPATFDANGGPIGTIDSPLIGIYTFTTRLRYADGTTTDLVTTKTYEQTTDILTPRATLTIPEVENAVRYDAPTQTYYVTSNDSHLALNYAVTAQFSQGATTIYDDSMPIRLRTEGADINVNNIDVATPNGSTDIELLEDRPYNLQATFTDQAGHSVTQNFRIIKDRAQPLIQTRFVTTDTGDQLTLTSMHPSDPANTYMTRSDEIFLDVIVLNEDEEVTINAAIGETALTGPIQVPNLLNGQQGARYRITGLTDNDITHIIATAKDTAQWTRSATAHIRRDNLAPVITGDVELNDIYTENPVPLNVSADDYTTVSYVVGYTANGQAVTADPAPFTGRIALPQGDISNLTLLFRDALGNQTQTYTLSNTNIHIDSIIPTGTITLNPTGATNQPTVELLVTNLNDAGPFINWEASIGGNIVGSGSILQTNYATTTSLGNIPLQLNRDNTINVILRDSVNNPSATTTLTILQDDLGPVITFTAQPTAGTTPYTWTYTATDGTGIGITQEATARVLDVSNGYYITTGLNTTFNNGTYSTTWTTPSTTPGHSYVLEVTAQDQIPNPSVSRSNALTFDRSPADDLDPLLDPIPLPPELSGTTITVTVSNGTDINYVAEDMPRGTALYLADVLAHGGNTLDNNAQYDKFPVGYYTITIVDNLDNTHVIEDYLVTPYYLDPGGDVNGDGFGGGISDHKLVTMAEEGGNVYDNTMTTQLNAIKAIIQNTIATSMPTFLQN